MERTFCAVNSFPMPQIFHHKERSSKNPAAGFGRAGFEAHTSKRTLGSTNRLHHRLEFQRFQGKFAVRPLHRPGQRDVFFNDTST